MIYLLSTVLAGVCWGCISLFLKPLAQMGFSSLQVMLARALISSVFLLVYILIKNPALLKFNLKDIWMFAGTGVISLTFFSLCYFKTILEVGTSIAVVLLYTSPIFVLVLSIILFKEKLTLKKIFATACTFIGCMMVGGFFSSGNHITLKGILIGLCAGLGYALYSIFSRYALKKYNSITVTFYTFVFSAVSLFPFVHVGQIPVLLNGKSVFFLLGIAFLCTACPYILYTFGLTGLETSKAAVLVTVEPLVGALIGFIFWKDYLDVEMIIGIVCIFISVIILGMPEKNKRTK